MAGAAERILPRITALLRWRPASRIHVVVLDSADFANGLASPLPFNYTMIFLSPPDEGELLQNREWLELVLTHELFHIVHLDKARGPPLGLRRRLRPRAVLLSRTRCSRAGSSKASRCTPSPTPARSYGRLGNSQFEGMMRAEAGRGFRSLAEINAGGRGFPLNRDYLYGGYFFAFLQERYGQKAVADFIESYSDNVIPFRVHSNPVGGRPARPWTSCGPSTRAGWWRASARSVPSAAEGEVIAAGLVAQQPRAFAGRHALVHPLGRLYAAAARPADAGRQSRRRCAA